MSNLLKIAKALVEKKWSVIPVSRDSKKPAIPWKTYQENLANEDNLIRWFGVGSNYNIGLVTGRLSGIIVIDCDTLEASDGFVKEYPEASTTLQVVTGRGIHYYFKYEEGIRNDTGKKLGEKIDVRGDGGYVVIPPSIHANGKVYVYRKFDIANLPTNLQQKITGNRFNDTRNDNILPRDKNTDLITQGFRNARLTSMAGSMRKAGFDYDSIKYSLHSFNERFCSPSLDSGEIEAIANSVSAYTPGTPSRSSFTNGGRTGITVRLDSIKPENTSWLWKNRIPIGKITLLEGDGGLGKSFLSLKLAAMVSNGKLLNREGKVLLMSAEDGLADTIRPRLESVDAKLDNIFAITGIRTPDGDKAIGLKELPVIKDLVVEHKPSFLVIDPIIAFMEGDTHRAGDVRRILAPLAAIAAENHLAVLMIRHLNKNVDAKATYRGQGSQDFFNAARSVFLAVKNPEDPSKSLLCHVKSNLGPLQKSLPFWINDNNLHFGEETYTSAEQALAKEKNE